LHIQPIAQSCTIMTTLTSYPNWSLIYTNNLPFAGRLTSLLILSFKRSGRKHCPITKILFLDAAENAVWLRHRHGHLK